MSVTTTVRAVSLEGDHHATAEPQPPAQMEETPEQVCATGGYPAPTMPEFQGPYIKRHLGIYFGLLKASDIVQINEDGHVIGGNRVAVNKAGFQIHGAIHKARSNINAICHTHSPAGKAWSTFSRPLDIINQDACTFLSIQAIYENFGGIVLERDKGQRIAAALGKRNRIAILQNHSLLTTRSTVNEAGYLFTLLERSCEVQIIVESAGLPKKIIRKREAEYTAKAYQDPVST
ncbi:class II Aldolase and Adducin domain protein [Fusarium tjaetaba]|uniref:Class II Aldolase and Adducin domain protein n=1 Tax=Fusarium tjaetaba TaxID=1567544 RepID=A0A8H5S0K1_9HYPO|nr:class II Aldolase and Adducin domain protein [Fusarium tjaetaba]KAF5643374.1 class II Aldolase and Adducin domain protein [Fusarium tjaetaba]